MAPAERDEVLEVGLATLAPVLDVMGFDEAAAVTTRELAAAVARRERAPKGRRDGAPLTPEREQLPVPLQQLDDRAVTRQPTRRHRCERNPFVELAPAVKIGS